MCLLCEVVLIRWSIRLQNTERFNLWLNVATEFDEKWYVRKYFYMLQILTSTIKQRLYSTTGCITQQIQPTLKYTAYFMQVTKRGQFFLRSQHVFACDRKQRPHSTTGCIMLQTQHHDANFEQSTTYTRIESWFLAILTSWAIYYTINKYRSLYNLWLNTGSVLCG